MTGPDPEQVRQTVVQAAIPLMEDLHTLTTAQIAQAAGVSEADLLTAFADTEAVMQACLFALMDAVSAIANPAEEIRKLHAIRTDQPLAARLVEVIDVLDAYYRRLRTDLDALPHTTRPATGAENDLRPFSTLPEIRQAVARVLQPDEPDLRLPSPVLAEAFVGMIFGGIRPATPNRPPLPADQAVHLFLHGALHTG
ncbi:TetR/AcrR family transcriptional regulator [Actinoplanes awajinensis]|uniref:TetR family transcriptional regulator n=1 Tax=Actinoplanes awajinensis subsp. mycoplanecinus TaxID=135947 RepID=A0A101JBV8_9ACTN|nr:TetR/AcrR family transcriptional regulator [Actinoplanes awajinensis]KUL23927.1 hypothetical protein ADL15_44740 [Actinoplanes awajinensis subsp. mycoplanecinus]